MEWKNHLIKAVKHKYEQGGKFKTPVAHTNLIKVEFLPGQFSEFDSRTNSLEGA